MKQQRIEIATGEKRIPEIVPVVQRDSGRELHCLITDLKIPAAAVARIYARKPSGKEIYNDCTVLGNTVVVKLTTQMLAETGKVTCQVEISEDSSKVSSFAFLLSVEARIDSGSAIESTDEFTALENAIFEAAEAAENANAAARELDGAYVLDRINPITSGSLNDYATPGIYTCTNSSIGGNITDQPDGKPKAGFKVVVEYVGYPNMILQTITYQGSLIHTYRRIRYDGVWKPWYGGPNNQWDAIGKLADLQTAEKGSLVGAINEVNTNLGNVLESGVYASGSTADPPIPLILDADLLGGQGPETYARQTDIETVSEAIPSPFRVRLVGNGRGALICPEDGIYLLLAGCRHDSSIYLEAIVSKHPNVNGGAPKVTVLKSAGMSVEATNSGGTIAVIADSTEDSLIRMCSIQFGSIT
jgi:hypothetical protein